MTPGDPRIEAAHRRRIPRSSREARAGIGGRGPGRFELRLVHGTALAANGTFAGRPDAAAIARRFEEPDLLLLPGRTA